jgi:hypothetical protein
MSKTFEVGQKLYMAYSSATTKEIRIFKATIAKVGKVRIDIKTEVDSRTNFIFAGREGGITCFLI